MGREGPGFNRQGGLMTLAITIFYAAVAIVVMSICLIAKPNR